MRHSLLVRALLFSLVPWMPALSQFETELNYTPGDGQGDDHTAFLWSPYNFQGPSLRGEDRYEAHVRYEVDLDSGKKISGQQYEWAEYRNTANPLMGGPDSQNCNLSAFRSVISSFGGSLAVLVAVGHGYVDHLVVELLASPTEAQQKWREYVDEDGPGPDQGYPPAFVDWGDHYGYGFIAVHKSFIGTYATGVNGSVIFIGTCYGDTVILPFVQGGARLAMGNNGLCVSSETRTAVRAFFEHLDGFHGERNRTAAAGYAAVNGGSVTYGIEGPENLNTTLSPRVVSAGSPCKIKTGDWVTVTFDTCCKDDPALHPVLSGIGCVLDPTTEEWLDAPLNRIIRIQCSAPAPPGAKDYCIRVEHRKVVSQRNVARLDGNQDPGAPPIEPTTRCKNLCTKSDDNAKGPSLDDFLWPVWCDDAFARSTTVRPSTGNDIPVCDETCFYYQTFPGEAETGLTVFEVRPPEGASYHANGIPLDPDGQGGWEATLIGDTFRFAAPVDSGLSIPPEGMTFVVRAGSGFREKGAVWAMLRDGAVMDNGPVVGDPAFTGPFSNLVLILPENPTVVGFTGESTAREVAVRSTLPGVGFVLYALREPPPEDLDDAGFRLFVRSHTVPDEWGLTFEGFSGRLNEHGTATARIHVPGEYGGGRIYLVCETNDGRGTRVRSEATAVSFWP
jgi:hypothetical protein